MKKLVLETTSPFQGLAELVAYDEGLFAKEGVQVEWADRDEAGIKTSDTSIKDAEGHQSCSAATARCSSRARPTCTMPANGATTAAPAAPASAAGRSAAAPSSPMPPSWCARIRRSTRRSSLPDRTVGVPFYAGTHYLALHLLEGFMPRELINVCSAPNGSRNRFNLMMKGEIEATTLTEPYITLAEKKGCRVICSAFFHGTEVASDRVDAETYAAFNRAVREAVRRINANKKAYLRYFIDYHKAKDPEIGTLKPEDLREGRIVLVDPAPIPADELQRTYEWVKSWGMLEETESPLQLVNIEVQKRAHAPLQ